MGKSNKKKQKAAAQKKQKHAMAAATVATSPTPTASQPVAAPSLANVEPRSTHLLDRAKQKAIVQRLMAQADAQGLQVGDKRFVIAAKWWERWRQFVAYDEDDNDVDRAAPSVLGSGAPSKISNLPLLQVPLDDAKQLDELMGAPLRPQLKENYHYALLPEEVWDALLCWYGGGPAIARFVVQVGDPARGNAFTRVEVYPELAGQEDDEAMDDEDGGDGAAAVAPKPVTTATTSALPRKPSSSSSSSSSSVPKICGACRATTGSLKRCGSCQLIWYCGSACQTAHWKYHKSICRSAGSSEDKENALTDHFADERRGKMGLRNLGNTCFMNSALQCLSHVELITSYFLTNRFVRDLNRDNPLGTGGNLATEYDALLKELWFGTSSSVAPSGLKRAIGRFAPQFSGFQQHDSQELLAYLLDGLHEDLNRVKQKPYTEVKESDGKQADREVAKEAWARHLLRNDSVFVDHVQGQFKSTVVCPVCAKVSITFDPYNCVQLELPIQQNRWMEAIVVPRGKSMMRYWVEVPKKGTILNLKRAVSKLCGLPTHTLLAADIYQSLVYRVIGDTERLARLRDEDRILLYEVEPPVARETDDDDDSSTTSSVPQLYYGFLYHRIDTTVVGDPLLFTFTADTTCAEILATWSEMLAAHVAKASGGGGTPSSRIPIELLAESVYLSNREGQFLRAESVPLSPTSRFLEYATLHPTEPLDDIVYMDVTWSTAMLSGARPDDEETRIVDHTSLRERGTKRATEGITLFDCFRNFTKPETLDQANLWYCSQCREHRQARKTMEIWKLPDVLIISLKRFEYRNAILRDKLDVFVDFPLDDLDMTPFCLDEDLHGDVDRLRYDLFAVSNHYGGMGFGHYTAFARSWPGSKAAATHPGWFSFDDSQVSPVMPQQVRTNAAYILFYKRRRITTTE